MSPFLREINPGLYHQEKQAPPSRHILFQDKPVLACLIRLESRKKTVSARVEYSPGMLVQHPLFGPGKVKSIPGPRRVEIAFDRHGDKILHLDYAKARRFPLGPPR